MYWLPYSSHTSHHSLKDSLPSLNLICHSKTDARFMWDGRKAVWSISYVSVVFFLSLKRNFIAYRSSKVSDCIFEIQRLWQPSFSSVYSSSCCRFSLEPEIINIRQSSHKMYSNNILNFQETTTVLNANTKNSENLSYAPRNYTAWSSKAIPFQFIQFSETVLIQTMQFSKSMQFISI